MKVPCDGIRAAALLMLSIAATSGSPAQAQDYPSRPVKIVTDGAAGSNIDVILRILCDRLSASLGQPVLTLNHPGGNGAIAARVASGSIADGYTLYNPALSAFVTPPGTAANLPLELPRDFAPIGLTIEAPLFIAVAPSLGVSTLSDLIALAKRRPHEISYATNGRGRLSHLIGELLQSRADIQLQMLPYLGGAAQALNDVMGGRVPIVIDGFLGVSAGVQAGALKLLAVSSERRLQEFADVPSVADTLPGFSATGWQVLVAPIGTPEPIISKINVVLNRVLDEAEIKSKLATFGNYVRPLSPTEVVSFVAAEQRMWAPVLKQITSNP
jgi:tripartite-type tricarboxylate transporter receptor subunit TctC